MFKEGAGEAFSIPEENSVVEDTERDWSLQKSCDSKDEQQLGRHGC